MSVHEPNAYARAAANANFTVWDTQYVPPSKAFRLYREALCQTYMPWSPEIGRGSEFHARIEMTRVRKATIARHRCSPHTSLRTTADIAESTEDCTYLVLGLSGEIECEQYGRTTLAKAWDILALDSAWPAKCKIGPALDVLVVTIPKSDLRNVENFAHSLANVLLSQNRTPLTKCLNLMTDRMIAASNEEMASLYDACLSLLPLEAGCFDCDRRDDEAARANYLLRAILGHIDRNIADGDLTPNNVAERFGISVRYVHKLFIGCGTTFCSYATSRRLEYIRRDLVSPTSRHQPISSVAFRWGFNDLSSFNRAFKSRFGCTPSQYRMRSEN